jgi:hypothetical protein
MPSFDVVCEADMVEVKNAVEQSNKEITTRFDFKGSSAKVEQKEKELTLFADSDFQLSQVYDVLVNKMTKRKVDVRFLDEEKVEKIGGDKVQHPGRNRARHRRQARRPAGGDGPAEKGHPGFAAGLQQLPRLRGSPPPADRRTPRATPILLGVELSLHKSKATNVATEGV